MAIVIAELLLLLICLFMRIADIPYKAIYGYQTSRAKKSPASWQFAQKRFGTIGSIFYVLAILVYFLGKQYEMFASTTQMNLVILVTGIVAAYILTEYYLKKKFS